MAILVTGAAGFIGFHVCQKLLALNEEVIGIDNINDYYDIKLKESRLAQLKRSGEFVFYRKDITDLESLKRIAIEHHNISRIVHLAAQPGVRYSIENPHAYIHANILGHLNILELAKSLPRMDHLVYASSSSVYGANEKIPFSTKDNVRKPISLYAATKLSDEAMSYCYSHMYNMPMTGLRFFTVYGPWGRPDMATYKFTKAIFKGKPIDVYNNGNMKRDFTYIDDIVHGVISALNHPPTIQTDDCVCHKIYNLGNHQSESLLRFIEIIEKAIGKKAELNMMPLQDGDVVETYADIDSAIKDLSFMPTTSIEIGIPAFVNWYKSYHNIA